MKFYNAIKHCLAVVVFAALCIIPAKAQQQEELTPEQRERKLYEFVDKEVERLTGLLKLDEGQQYYVTISLTECMQNMQSEMEALSKSGVQNSDLYIMVQDKWMEKLDNDYESFFTPEQWKKYLRSGADRARRAREKRRAKAESEGTVTNN